MAGNRCLCKRDETSHSSADNVGPAAHKITRPSPAGPACHRLAADNAPFLPRTQPFTLVRRSRARRVSEIGSPASTWKRCERCCLARGLEWLTQQPDQGDHAAPCGQLPVLSLQKAYLTLVHCTGCPAAWLHYLDPQQESLQVMERHVLLG